MKRIAASHTLLPILALATVTLAMPNRSPAVTWTITVRQGDRDGMNVPIKATIKIPADNTFDDIVVKGPDDAVVASQWTGTSLLNRLIKGHRQ